MHQIINNALAKRNFLLCSWINSGSPIIAEIMSQCGFDFLVVDAEHSAVDIPQAQALFQAIKAGNPNCLPMVRLTGNTYSETKRYLDAGAMGIIAPLINTKEEAQELVRSVKYPPKGERGVGYGRSHGYGFDFDNYMQTANEDIFVCIQIEHIKAIENLDEILNVEGIDAIFIGPYDLSASMGITAQFDHPDYIQAINNIMAKCSQYNILAGIHVVQPNTSEVFQKVKTGFQMIAYSLDITIIGTSFRNGLLEINNLFKNN
jgi:2-dehydro-3-deoxyglucarate aldolase